MCLVLLVHCYYYIKLEENHLLSFLTQFVRLICGEQLVLPAVEQPRFL